MQILKTFWSDNGEIQGCFDNWARKLMSETMAVRAKTKAIQLDTVKTFKDCVDSSKLLGNLMNEMTISNFQDRYRLYTWFKPVKHLLNLLYNPLNHSSKESNNC